MDKKTVIEIIEERIVENEAAISYLGEGDEILKILYNGKILELVSLKFEIELMD